MRFNWHYGFVAIAAAGLGAVRLAGDTTGASPKTFTSADYDKHVAVLKHRLPPGDFSIIVQPPFVVIGDESEARIRQRSQDTVKWAVDRLKQNFFKRDPQQILDIYLFKDETSYNQNARLLFGSKPTTPFGYFSPSNRALVMNIATGGGTLVHEIVHPFVEANFPDCPSWFNEGLGSLYEQCGDKNGRIYGYTNWRLTGLQRAIRADKVPSFETLMAMDRDTFYEQDRGTNYGQARYLCYYLQEKNLLTKFYREFVDNHKTDTTGISTLKKVLGANDLSAFKKQWEAFVLKLRFP